MTIKEFIIQKILQFDILTIGELEHASEEEQQEFLEYAANEISLRLLERIVEALPEDQKATFRQLLTQPDAEEEWITLLVKYVPHAYALCWEEFLLFKEEILQRAQDTDRLENLPAGPMYSWFTRLGTGRRRLSPVILYGIFGIGLVASVVLLLLLPVLALLAGLLGVLVWTRFGILLGVLDRWLSPVLLWVLGVLVLGVWYPVSLVLRLVRVLGRHLRALRRSWHSS